jgi:cadmium resistance protein CadD (predicted permease)
VTPSPEPISNITLSAGEDALAVFLTWLATQHPIAAGVIAAVFLVAILLAMRWIVRTISRAFQSTTEAFISQA